jgi:hypothetical protein
LAAAEDRAEVEAGAEVEALAAAEDGVTSVFVGALTSLDSDARLLWPLAASTPMATATATVRVPAVMRTARFRFRRPLAVGRSSNRRWGRSGGWSLMTFSLPGAGRFRG